MTDNIVPESETKQFTIKRDGERSLSFKGRLIAEAKSSPNNACSNWSHETGRWTELRLYRTAAGKLVAEQVQRTQWQGESDSHAARVCTSDQQVVDFLGLGWLAKELYDEAEVDYSESVDKEGGGQ
jgi:hypothetical protein